MGAATWRAVPPQGRPLRCVKPLSIRSALSRLNPPPPNEAPLSHTPLLSFSSTLLPVKVRLVGAMGLLGTLRGRFGPKRTFLGLRSLELHNSGSLIEAVTAVSEGA